MTTLTALNHFIQSTQGLRLRWDIQEQSESAVTQITGGILLEQFKRRAMTDFELVRTRKKNTLFFVGTANVYIYENKEQQLWVKLSTSLQSGGSTEVHTITVSEKPL